MKEYSILTEQGETLFKGTFESFRACLQEAVGTRVCLEGALFRDIVLENCSFLRHGRFSGATFFSCYLQGVDFTSSVLNGAKFSHCDLRYANFSYTRLDAAKFNNSQLSDAHFKAAQLCNADLSSADLWFTDFTDADLTGTVLDPNNKPNGLCWDAFTEVKDSPGWVYGYRTRRTPCPGKLLADDRIYAPPVFSTSDRDCHPGFYLWPSLEQSLSYNEALEVEDHVIVKSRKEDIHYAGRKWRSRAIWVLGTA